MNRKCQICGKLFHIEIYKIKNNRGKFCSKLCSNKAMSKRLIGHPCWVKSEHFTKEIREKMREHAIENKTRPPLWKGHHHSEATKEKLRKMYEGDKSSSWKGGRKTTPRGYVLIYSPTHPNKTKSKYVPEHRLVMEKQIGRYLTKNEIVHHKNGIKNDNRTSNLILTVSNKNWHPCNCPKCGFEFLIK